MCLSLKLKWPFHKYKWQATHAQEGSVLETFICLNPFDTSLGISGSLGLYVAPNRFRLVWGTKSIFTSNGMLVLDIAEPVTAAI